MISSQFASQAVSVLLLVLGFGFVIFFHELGHFLAAKWVGIKVEQFAVGFGQALVSWREGMGWTVGSSAKKYEELESQGQAAGIGETEYRLNWIPLGGYVKMLGQDDLRPNAKADDPRSYNRKSISARMVVVSAGVIMNIILAAIGFMVVFLMGFRAPPAVVGNVVPDSPADKAGLVVGDRILYFDGKYQHDFTKISLNTALVEEGKPVPIVVRHVDGTETSTTITAERPGGEATGFLALGIEQPHELRGVDAKDAIPAEIASAQLMPAEMLAIQPGDTITAVNGQPVQVAEYYKLDQAVQNSFGKPVELTVVHAKGQSRTIEVHPKYDETFGSNPLSIAGMVPRAAVINVLPESPAKGKLLPGDAIETIRAANGGDSKTAPTGAVLKEWLNNAGHKGQAITLMVRRGEDLVTLPGIKPSVKVGQGRLGVGIGLTSDGDHAVVAETIKGSPAEEAGVPAGATIVAVAGQPVTSFYDVQHVLAEQQPETPVTVVAKTAAGAQRYTLHLNKAQIEELQPRHWFTSALMLHDRSEPRKTSNPLKAAAWGVSETRDFVLQFYLTLRRMFQGSISYTNMMGPVGIVYSGSKIAFKGNDWLIWFLSMISANLAVVNFLPIPIVDGGLFTFLVVEKIMGRPLSQRAQSIAQVVGLALLLGVFLLVTYQDISRIF